MEATRSHLELEPERVCEGLVPEANLLVEQCFGGGQVDGLALATASSRVELPRGGDGAA